MPISLSDKHLRMEPWNKGKLIGQKAPLKVSEVWAIRVRLRLRLCQNASTAQNYLCGNFLRVR